MTENGWYQVVVVKPNVKQYRRTLWPKLAAALSQVGVELTVAYSAPDPAEAAKGDSIDIGPPLGLEIPGLHLAGHRALLQLPPAALIARADLVIVVQASSYLLNYPLLLLSVLGLKRVALWGHGWNHQGDPRSASEIMKRRLARVPDWWFAYSDETRRYLVSIGMDPERITVLENAIDTRELRRAVASVTDEELAALRSKLGLEPGDRVGLYCGSLYAEKRIPFLLDSAERIAATVPGFRLLVVGGGGEAETVRAHAARHSAVRYAGPLFGREKAACFRMAELIVNPGAVGLGILDSFAANLPFVTTRAARHGPEIDYLAHDVNGLMVDGDAETFARVVCALLNDPPRLARLAQGASAAAERYTVENMVENVKRGVVSCLGIGRASAARGHA